MTEQQLWRAWQALKTAGETHRRWALGVVSRIQDANDTAEEIGQDADRLREALEDMEHQVGMVHYAASPSPSMGIGEVLDFLKHLRRELVEAMTLAQEVQTLASGVKSRLNAAAGQGQELADHLAACLPDLEMGKPAPGEQGDDA
jgi:hypothetical protein